MEGRELRGDDVGLRVKDPFGAIVHVHIPDWNEAIRIMWRGRVLGVGSQDKLWKL
jgi:hypothetical protein